MGANQSDSGNSKETFTKKEVEKILEKQRKLYENKQEEILSTIYVSQNEARGSDLQNQRTFTKKEVENILDKQRKCYENKQQEIRRTVQVSQIETRGSDLQTQCQERQRTPYSFSQNDLNIGVAQPTSTSLYPDISAAKGATYDANSTPYHANVRPSAPHFADAATSSPHSTVNPVVGVPHKAKSAAGASNNANVSTNSNVNATTGAIPKKSVRNRNQPQPTEDNELKCRTCKQTFTIRVFQCQNGHSSCNNCKARNTPCGVCGIRISDVRNRALETFIGEMVVRCPNFKDGCSLHFKILELELHTKECPYGELECPLATFAQRCLWRGKLPQLSFHFDEMHQDNKKINVGTEQELFINQLDSHIMQLVQLGPFMFYFQVKVSAMDRMIYVIVQMVGTAHSAEKWTYELHIYNKRQPRRKYQYTHICHSNNIPLNDIVDKASCALIPLSYAKTFLNDDRMMYKLYIKKETEQRPHGGARRRC